MIKKLLFLLVLSLLAISSYAEIENEIRFNDDGKIYSFKNLYQKSDTLYLNFVTPTVHLITGNYGIRREDEVESATARISCNLIYKETTINLLSSNEIKLPTGKDVSVSPISKTYKSISDLKTQIADLMDDEEQTSITIEMTYKINCSYKEGHNRSATYKTSKSIAIYTCNAGVITVDESIMPNIAGENASPIYGLYNSNSDIQYPILSIENPTSYQLGSQEYVVCNVLNAYLFPFHKNTKQCNEYNANYDFYLSYPDFIEKNNQLQNRETRYITRTYYNREFNCSSNTIEIKTVDTISLDGFKEDELSIFLCPFIPEDDYEEPDSFTCNSLEVFSINGKSVDWEQTSYKPEIYGVEYGWEYRTSTNGNWYQVSQNINTDKSSPKLCLPRNFIQTGKVFYFRQFITITRFGQKRIYANGDHNIVTVQLYRTPNASNFIVSELPTYCANSLASDTISVQFKPSKNATYCPSNPDVTAKDFNLKFSSSSTLDVLNSETYSSSLSLPFILVPTENISCQINIQDGCNNIVKLPVNMTVNQQPSMLKQYIDIDGGSSNFSNSDPLLQIKAPQGGNVTIRLNNNDPDKFSSRYFISLLSDSTNANGEYLWGERSIINIVSGYNIPSFIANKAWYGKNQEYIKIEKENITTGCMSEPLFIRIQYLGEIRNNHIEIANNVKSTVAFVCPNTYNPSINGDVISGGYGDSTYSYIWQYSNDSINWINMSDKDSKSITTHNLNENEWNKSIDKKYFIRRMATSTEKNAPANSAIKSFSNTIIIQPYTSPLPELTINGQQTDLSICFNEDVHSLISFSNQENLTLENYPFKKYLAYENRQGERALLNNTKLTITKDTTIYAATEFCGSTIYSPKGIDITAGENLSVDTSEYSLSTCLVRGENGIVSISSHSGYSYQFIIDNDTINKDEALIPLPMTGARYFTIIKSKDNCSQSSILCIDGNKMQEPLSHHNLSATSEGLTIKDEQILVCQGNVLNVFAPFEKTSPEIEYNWKINQHILDPNVYQSNTLSTSALDFPDKDYHIIRTSHLVIDGISCQSITDELLVHTYPSINGAIIDSDKNKVCFNDNITLSLETTSLYGGSGNYTYNWYKVEKDSSVLIGSNNESFLKLDKLTETAAYFLNIQDNFCPSYQYHTPSRIVEVEKDLSFSLTASPSTININSLADGSSINVNISSTDISPIEKINAWINGKKIKTNEAYLTGINYSISEKDFIENIATISVERFSQTLNSCRHSASTDILLNEGFDGVPVILSSATETNNSITCDSSDVILRIDLDQLPKYDNQNITASNFSFQWYRRSHGNWSSCGTSDSLIIRPISGETIEYRCKLSYTPQGGLKQSVYSDSHYITGISPIKIGTISFDKNKSSVYHACKNSDGYLVISSDSIITASKFQWYQKSGEGDWTEIPTERGTTGTDSRLCTINLENYQENTSFKLVATNECGVTSESYNHIQLIFNAGAKLSTNDIIITSNTIYEGLSLPSVSFCIPKDHNNTYIWSCDPTLSSSSWSTGNPITLDNNGKGFSSGTDSVFVYMISNGYGNCSSDTMVYHFNVFEQLNADGLSFSPSASTLCSGQGKFDVILSGITGGNGDYHIDWLYKSKSMNGFSPITEGANLPFSYYGEILTKSSTNRSHAILSIGELMEECEFYAVISCENNYIGKNYTSNSIVKSVYPTISNNKIDNRTLLFCYGDALTSIDGDDATGGSNNRTYQWIKSNDRSIWEEIAEQTEASLIGQSSQENYQLKNSTYYCRIVRDGCGNADTSAIKTIQVKQEVRVQPDDILFTDLIPRGDKATIWGVNDQYDYIMFDNYRLVLDTIAVREPFSSHNINETSATFYVKSIYDGCLSSNFDTINISTYDIDGGNLSFDNFTKDPNTNKYWICSGANAGRISADGGGNLSYRWFYTVNDQGSARAYSLYSLNNTSIPVSTSSVLLDTCNIRNVLTHASGTQLEKKVSFFRISYFSLDGKEKSINSDTISLYIVPNLNLTSTLLLDGSMSIAGTINAEKEIYCNGESGALIDGTINHNSSLYQIWSNNQFGPFLYDNDANDFETWFEYGKGGVWEKEETHKGIGDYAQYFNLPIVDTTYSIRRAFSDGCSTAYSNVIKQSLSDKSPSASKVVIKGFSSDGKSITKGIEIGDALSVNYTELGYECYWFADEECTDSLVSNNQLVVFEELTEESPTTLYLKRKDNSLGECFSSALAIPLEIFTKSNGGRIYKNQIQCRNKMFETIYNSKLASGYSFAPVSGKPQNFQYQWQISMNENASNWINIDQATIPDSLSAETINKLVKDGVETYFIRRMATSESGRVCYSDTVQLQFFSPFKPGVLSLTSNKTSFCFNDTLPTIESTSPQGGYYGFMNIDGYSYTWEIAINNDTYIPLLETYGRNNTSIDLDFLVHYSGIVDLDFTKNNIIKARAIYGDECQEIYSQPIQLTLWAETNKPSIYQDKDSCDADAVTIKTYDSEHYLFTWMVLDDNKQVTWSYSQDSLRLQRVNEMMVTKYAVMGINKESNCPTELTYFNIDSLPNLHQDQLIAPNPICYNGSFTLYGGKISGGNGDKKYLWEYSYDLKDFTSMDSSEHLTLSNCKRDIYVRRIVFDKCNTDTSNTVLIAVKEKINIQDSDVKLLDHVCTGQYLKINVNPVIDDSIQSLHSSLNIKNHFWVIYDENDTTAIGNNIGLTSSKLNGFEEEEKRFYFKTCYEDSLGQQCYSQSLPIIAHNAPILAEKDNTISCDDISPCNGNATVISGSKFNDSSIQYNWYSSKNRKDWTKIAHEESNDLQIITNDTTYFVRVVFNGCTSIVSDTITIYGKHSEDYDYVSSLQLNITTLLNDSSDSVIVNIRSHAIENDFETWGDGTINAIGYGSTILPYSADIFSDSMLYITKGNGCYNSYQVNPIRGGRIYSSKEIFVCKEAEMPELIVTEVDGGTGNYSFQWEYKNKYVKEYVSIPNATEANLIPPSITTQTWFRRVTTDNEYTHYSNEISIDITNGPTVEDITIKEDSSFFKDLGLLYTNSLVELTEDMVITLIDSTSYAEVTQWEHSTDGTTWSILSKCAHANGVQSLSIQCKDEERYYRLTAKSNCDTIISNIFHVVRLNIQPIVDEDIHLSLPKCPGDYLVIQCTGDNEYIYKYQGYTGKSVLYYDTNDQIDYYSTWTNEPVYCLNITDPFDLTITRQSIKTGLKTTKTIHIPIEIIKANFSFSIADTEYTLGESNVPMDQGTLVRFHNKSEGDIVSYYWELITPMNTPQNIISYGLYSLLENPECYFYNSGRYSISLTVTNQEGCSSHIINKSLNIPSSTIKKWHNIDATFVEQSIPEKGNPIVSPTFFNDYITINFTGKFNYRLCNTSGQTLINGDGCDMEIINTSNLPNGIYILGIEDLLFKLIK